MNKIFFTLNCGLNATTSKFYILFRSPAKADVTRTQQGVQNLTCWDSFISYP